MTGGDAGVSSRDVVKTGCGSEQGPEEGKIRSVIISQGKTPQQSARPTPSPSNQPALVATDQLPDFGTDFAKNHQRHPAGTPSSSPKSPSVVRTWGDTMGPPLSESHSGGGFGRSPVDPTDSASREGPGRPGKAGSSVYAMT
ncbi:MAG: hypothetical protein Ct9H300mP10_07130 [Methanobacteriota archaeon]|nr:MAG: hypothetical protein Ct9H300mP10_07130 [Euryarchaeota archaeon]